MIWLKYAAIGETREHLFVPSSDDMMTLFPEVDESIRPSQNILTPIRYDDRINARSLPSSSPYIKPGNSFASHRACQNVLSTETHRRAATGNTKSREVAGALAGTAPSSTARNSVTHPEVLWKNRACHLIYTRSGGCRRAPNSFLHTKTRVNVSPSRGRLPGTTLASALKSWSSPGVRLDL